LSLVLFPAAVIRPLSQEGRDWQYYEGRAEKLTIGRNGESDRGASPIFFGPGTLRRTWGTRRFPLGDVMAQASGLQVESCGIPPFAKNAKDGAPVVFLQVDLPHWQLLLISLTELIVLQAHLLD
jgi:hypothetical protein